MGRGFAWLDKVKVLEIAKLLYGKCIDKNILLLVEAEATLQENDFASLLILNQFMLK